MISKRPVASTLVALAAITSLAACGDSAGDETPGEAGADTAEMSVIEARQANFEEIGDSFKVIRDQMEGGEPDFAAILTAAQTIQTDVAKIPDFFPEGTSIESGADTEALATIWEQAEDFAAANERITAAAAGLVAAAEAGDPAGMGPAIGELGGACKNCHDTFRLDDE